MYILGRLSKWLSIYSGTYVQYIQKLRQSGLCKADYKVNLPLYSPGQTRRAPGS